MYQTTRRHGREGDKEEGKEKKRNRIMYRAAENSLKGLESLATSILIRSKQAKNSLGFGIYISHECYLLITFWDVFLINSCLRDQKPSIKPCRPSAYR